MKALKIKHKVPRIDAVEQPKAPVYRPTVVQTPVMRF
jgi:hypothetical protein